MNYEEKLKNVISEAFDKCFDHELKESEINLQPTRKEFEGQYTFVTFPYSRFSRLNPTETGEKLGEFLKSNHDFIENFNVVKGFLNISFSQSVWLKVIEEIVKDENYGKGASKGRNVVVEYSSPNTNKPLHLGHLRNIFLGYSVAQIARSAGYDVEMVNLVNDRGIHICKSMVAYQKFGNDETPESSGLKGDHLIGKYYVLFDQKNKEQIARLVSEGMSSEDAEKKTDILKEAQTQLKNWENGDEETIALWKKLNSWVYDGFHATYDRMGVHFDKFYYESDTYLLGKDIVLEGLEKNVLFKKEDGSIWIDLTSEGLDQKLLLRSDGTSVYMTQDLGTADLKYKDYHFDKSVYVVGNEQDYHFEVLFKILEKLGRPYASGMKHLSYGMVDLPGGKMKSREGTVVDADDLMDEMAGTAKKHTEELGKIDEFSEEQASELYETLSLGAMKFFLLKVDPKKRMLFNPEESIQFHGNTGPFIQYTHARISAILRRAEQLGIDFKDLKYSEIERIHKIEESIIFLMSSYPQVIQNAAEEYAPSQIANFAYELAKEYNKFYTEVSIFGEKNDLLLKFRVAFSYAIARTIRHAMGLLGITVPDRM